MRRKRIILAFIIITVVASAPVLAETLSAHANYTTPIGNGKIDPSVGIGVIYRFWSVFTFSGTMYTEILFGAENVFNISQIRPIGLFSGGLGMKIPLGAFNITFGWQKFFTGIASEAGVYPHSDSYSIGATVDLSDSFGIAIFTRRLFNFIEQAVNDEALRIESAEDAVETVGVGLQFHFF